MEDEGGHDTNRLNTNVCSIFHFISFIHSFNFRFIQNDANVCQCPYTHTHTHIEKSKLNRIELR